MIRILGRLCAPIALVAVAAAAPAAAQKADPAPKPDTYLCPHVAGGAIDCYLDAIDHLYTMCRQVKSIEIIEFGYEKSDEGVNGAKTAYCVDKHELSMKRPLQSALREAGKSRAAVDALRTLHEYWLLALAELKWNSGESDEQYKARTAQPYEAFRDRGVLVRAAIPAGKGKSTSAAAPPVPAKSPN